MTFHSKANSTKQQTSTNDETKMTKQDNANINIMLTELDKLNDNLSAKVTNDISQVRINALKIAQAQQQQALFAPFKTWLARLFSTNLVSLTIIPKAMFPIGVAAAIVMMFSFTKLTSQAIPEMPQALASVNMPNEDLALLEDLEFVTWLATHEQKI